MERAIKGIKKAMVILTKDIKKAMVILTKGISQLDQIEYPPTVRPQVPRKIAAKSAAIRNTRTIYKQPRARAGFRRGQRR